MNAFGELLRKERKKANKTMGELGRHLGCSVTYMSDVELGRRPPLAPERICAAAAFLSTDAHPLLAAAAQTRGAIQLHTASENQKRVQVGAGLMRRWAELTDDDLEAIERVLDRSGTKE